MFDFIITGIVQGVGFRPFILREARKAGLKGFVQNTGEGVRIVADDKGKVLAILERVPVLARVESIKNYPIRPIRQASIRQAQGLRQGLQQAQGLRKLEIENEELEIGKEFEIRGSVGAERDVCTQNPPQSPLNRGEGIRIPPDVAVCEECLQELFDSDNRRCGYFHIGCTDCGPRFSIMKGYPFDRENTVMGDFSMCESCCEEYGDPENRRMHAQGIVCEGCGPQLINNKIHEVGILIKQGKIVTVKGIGGFSLVCLTKERVVQNLRKLLHRPNKPFALMAKDLGMIKKFVHTSKEEEKLLKSSKRPIVLLKKKGDGMFHISENDRLGFILPYAPLHYLLFEYLDAPIIFTSSNMPGMPITIKKEEQFVKHILDYNREIVNFSDDSIVKVIGDLPLLIRRSRGYVPEEINVPGKYQTFEDDILAVGGEMKNTFCLKRGNCLLLSQELGNTFHLENFENYKQTLNSFLKFTGRDPKVVLCDKNPEFNTHRFAKEFAKEKGIECHEVQHHKAHVFSVALEHGLDDFIGIAADGMGMGEDGNVWGGEVFHCGRRIGKLEDQVLVGGDMANKEPVRMLVGILSKFLSVGEIQKLLCVRELNIYQHIEGEASSFRRREDLSIKSKNHFSLHQIKSFINQKEQNFNCIASSSCGRILDCVAVLLGVCDKNDYEGRGGQMLEQLSVSPFDKLPFGKLRVYDSEQLTVKKIRNRVMFGIEPLIEKQEDIFVLNTTFLFKYLVENMGKVSREELAFNAQLYLAKGFLEMAKKYNSDLPVVWSGGCAYNTIMTSFLVDNGVLVNREVPCGDGGISMGQVAYFLWKNSLN